MVSIIPYIKNIYLYQREHLKGGNEIVIKDGKYYQIWDYDIYRPLTSVEYISENMISEFNIDQNLLKSLYLSIELVKSFDIDEDSYERYIPVFEDVSQEFDFHNDNSYKIESVTDIVSNRISDYYRLFLPAFMTNYKPKYRNAISKIMPDLMHYYKTDNNALIRVIEKWSYSSNQEVKDISSILHNILIAMKTSHLQMFLRQPYLFCRIHIEIYGATNAMLLLFIVVLIIVFLFTGFCIRN